jgi:hypothetical protein
MSHDLACNGNHGQALQLLTRDPAYGGTIRAGARLPADVASQQVDNHILLANAPHLVREDAVHDGEPLAGLDLDTALFAHFAAHGLRDGLGELNDPARDAPLPLAGFSGAPHQKRPVVTDGDGVG